MRSSHELKVLESHHAYSDNADFRCDSKTDAKQKTERDLRHANRSGIVLSPVSDPMDMPACLGYAEMSIGSFLNMLKLADNVIGHVPIRFLDIGHGLGHLVVAASTSERCSCCDGIEIAPKRFSASLTAQKIAETNGFVKTPMRLLKGDVLENQDIQLHTYNVFNFFDKVCKETSQKVFRKVITEHVKTNFELGPILYCTCMGEHFLEQALLELRESIESHFDRLLINRSRCMDVSTRFARQTFKCTLVQVYQRPESPSILKVPTPQIKMSVKQLWRSSSLVPKETRGTELTLDDFKVLEPLSVNANNLTPELNNRHLSELIRLFKCDGLLENVNTIVLMNTFFYTKLEQLQPKSNVEAATWISKQTSDVASLLKDGHLMFAVHTKGPLHWFLVHVRFGPKQVIFLDSIKKDHSKWFERILAFLEHLADSNTVRFDRSEWKMKEPVVPQQENGYDCGVFTCIFMLYSVAAVIQDQPCTLLPFDQRHMDDARHSIAHAFMEGSMRSILEDWFVRFYLRQ